MTSPLTFPSNCSALPMTPGDCLRRRIRGRAVIVVTRRIAGGVVSRPHPGATRQKTHRPYRRRRRGLSARAAGFPQYIGYCLRAVATENGIHPHPHLGKLVDGVPALDFIRKWSAVWFCKPKMSPPSAFACVKSKLLVSAG